MVYVTDPCAGVEFVRVCTGRSPLPEGVLPLTPGEVEDTQENVVPAMSESRTTGVLGSPEHTCWERVVLVTLGLGLTRTA
jgi:hypothetical protein